MVTSGANAIIVHCTRIQHIITLYVHNNMGLIMCNVHIYGYYGNTTFTVMLHWIFLSINVYKWIPGLSVFSTYSVSAWSCLQYVLFTIWHEALRHGTLEHTLWCLLTVLSGQLELFLFFVLQPWVISSHLLCINRSCRTVDKAHFFKMQTVSEGSKRSNVLPLPFNK